MITNTQRAYMHAKDKFERFNLTPARELIEAANLAVAEAIERALETEKVMEKLRPVWAQGWSTDSEAAQASANALSELWALLGVDNQTAAVSRLECLIAMENEQ